MSNKANGTAAQGASTPQEEAIVNNVNPAVDEIIMNGDAQIDNPDDLDEEFVEEETREAVVRKTRPTNAQVLDSQELAVFCELQGVTKLNIQQGKVREDGTKPRRFADTIIGRIYFSHKCDTKKLMHVAKGEYGAYWAFNTSTSTVDTIEFDFNKK